MANTLDSDSDQSFKNTELFYLIRKKNEVEDEKLKQVKTCLVNGADLNAVDKNNQNNTVLHVAIKKNYFKIIDYLLNSGARTDIENIAGRNALALAQTLNCNQEILDLVEKHSKISNVEDFTGNELNCSTVKIDYLSQKLVLWDNLKKYSEMLILEINCEANPAFLQQKEFYNAIETAGNLFFVDVMLSHMQHINEDFIKSQLSRLNKHLIIQCGSHLSTKVYVKDSPVIDLNRSIEMFNEDKLTEKLSNGFGINLIVDALSSNYFGTFKTEQRSLLNISFNLDKHFNGWKLIDYAIQYGDLLTVRSLSLHSWNLSKLNSKRTSTLSLAAEHGDVNKLGAVLRVKFPIELDKSISIPEETAAHFDKCKRQMLETAVRAGNCDVISFMIRCGVQLDDEIIELAWDNKKYDVVLFSLKADCVFPCLFDLKDIDETDSSYLELKSFVEERDELHGLIKKGDLDRVKAFVMSHPRSKFYLNAGNKSAVYIALLNNRLSIFIWLKLHWEADFRDSNERKGLNEGKKDSAADAMVPLFVPVENAHILQLVAKSRSCRHYPGFKEHIEAIYIELDRIPQISTVFKVIQFCDQVDIIYDFDKDSIVDVNVASSEREKGLCEYNTGRIYIGAKVEMQQLLGTIAHELTHLAMQTIYGNNCNPYKLGDSTTSDFDAIVKETKRNSGTDAIISRVFSCYANPVHWPSELIVRVNHMLAVYGASEGLRLLELQAKSLLEFYTDRVEPKLKLLVTESHLIKPRNTIKFLNEYSGVISRLKEMKIEFNNTEVVKDFLSNENKHFLVLSSSCTWLSLINAYQNVSFTEDCLLIFQFDHYLSRKTEINQAFYTEAGKLLILECQNEVKEQQFIEILFDLGNLLRKKQNKKIIFIMETDELTTVKGHLISQLFNVNFEIVYDIEFTLDDLTSDSKQTFLKQNVILQNRSLTLGDLVDRYSCRLVDSEILTKLVNNEKVSIGKQATVPYGYDEVYYVERAFNNQIKLLKAILNDTIADDVFAICESTVEVVKILVKEKHRVCLFSELNSDENSQMKFIVLDNSDAENQFKKLRKTFELRTLHWLKVEVGDFLWQKSHCSIKDFPLFIKHLKNTEFQEILSKFIVDIFADSNSVVDLDGLSVVQLINDEIEKACKNIENDEETNIVQFDKIIVDIDIFNGHNDVIAISHTDEATVNKLTSNNIAVQHYNENEVINCNFIILESDKANEEFEKLCVKCPLRNVHWLKREISGLFWHQTSAVSVLHRGFTQVLSILRTHIDHSFTEVYQEIDFVDKIDDFRVVLVPDTAGMGKTTVLTRIIKLLNAKHPELWVLRVDLNDYTKILNHPSSDVREIDEALNFFVKRLLDSRKESKLETKFERNLLLNLMKNRENRIIVMFDGFDEIKDEHQRVIIHVLNALKQTKVKQIWVTTRPFIRNYLEDQLQMLPYTLEPFTEAEQITFLIDYWKQRFDGQIDEQRLGQYADALIKHLCQSISDKAKTFSGIPLQTRMIAEAFEGHCKEFCQSDLDIPIIPEKFDLIDLYQLFLEYKYNIYQLEKNEFDSSKPQVEWQIQKWKSKFLENHQISAFFTLFDEADLNRLLTKSDQEAGQSFIKDIEDGKGNTGVIDRIVEGRPHFVHLTFAEYLIAEFIVNILRRTRRNNKLEKYILISVFGNPVLEVVRAFIDSHLNKTQLPIESLTNYGVQLKRLWCESGNPLKLTNGHTILHVAAIEGNVNIAKFILTSVETLGESEKVTLNSLVTAEDALSMNCFHLAAEAGHVDLLELLLKYHDGLIDVSYIGTKKKTPGNALYLAAKSGRFDVCDWLLERGADVNAPLRGNKKFNNMKLIDLAAEQGDLDLIKWLVKHNVDVNIAVNDNERYDGLIPMHIAANNGKWPVINWLVSEKLSDINHPFRHGKIEICPLAARMAGAFNVAELRQWVELGLDVNGADETGQSALHVAAVKNAYETAEYLIACGANVNARDEFDFTPLHEAVTKGNVRMVQLLLKHGADRNAESNVRKMKPIDIALRRKELKENAAIMEILREKH